MTVSPPVSDEPAAPESHDDDEGFDLSSIRVEDAGPEEQIRPPKPPRSRSTRTSKSTPSKPPKAKATAPPYRKGAYVAPLTQLYGYAALGLGMTGDQQCAEALMKSAEGCAVAWDNLAKENIAVRRALQAIIEGGAWSGVVLAHAPLAVAILAHHTNLPAGIAGMFASNEGEDNAPTDD